MYYCIMHVLMNIVLKKVTVIVGVAVGIAEYMLLPTATAVRP